MLALCSLGRKFPLAPHLLYIIMSKMLNFAFLTCFEKQFSFPRMFWQNQINQQCDMVFEKGFFMVTFHYNSFPTKLCCIVCTVTLIPIISKFLAMYFNTILGFILTPWHSFCAVLGDNLDFLPCPCKVSVLPNCLSFFITGSTIDVEITNRFEIVL